MSFVKGIGRGRRKVRKCGRIGGRNGLKEGRKIEGKERNKKGGNDRGR
jgi:hypothetical protein